MLRTSSDEEVAAVNLKAKLVRDKRSIEEVAAVKLKAQLVRDKRSIEEVAAVNLYAQLVRDKRSIEEVAAVNLPVSEGSSGFTARQGQADDPGEESSQPASEE
jgi:hypothetical protein